MNVLLQLGGQNGNVAHTRPNERIGPVDDITPPPHETAARSRRRSSDSIAQRTEKGVRK